MVYGNFQIVKMTTKRKCTVLSIEVICECLDKGYSKREMAFICTFICTFITHNIVNHQLSALAFIVQISYYY